MNEKFSHWTAILKKVDLTLLFIISIFFYIIITNDIFDSGEPLKAIFVTLQSILIIMMGILLQLVHLQRQLPKK